MKAPQDKVDYPSPLCEVCKIKMICHELQKFIASSCQHFEGEPPEGFYRVDSVTCKFVYNTNRGHKGYFIKGSGRNWVDESTFNWKIKEDQDRREYLKTHRTGQKI